MTNYRKVEVICQQCKASFLVISTVVWHTKLCPTCRVGVTREQQKQRNKERTRHNCIDCGNVIYGHFYGTDRSLRCRPCYFKHSRQYPKSAHNKYMNAYGYIFVSVPEHPFLNPARKRNYFIAEHRYVVEKALGRALASYEIVHHLNGIRHDNRLPNLVVVNRHNHHWDTLLQLQRKRIRDLEAQLSQQKLL